MKAFHVRDALRVASAAAVLAAASTSASAVQQVVFDSLTNISPSAELDANGNWTGTYTWSYVDFSGETVGSTTYNAVAEVGDQISLAGTLRAVDYVNIGLFQAAGAGASSFSLTVSIYDTAGSLLVSQTSGTVSLGSVLTTPALIPNGVLVPVQVDLGPFNLPDTFTYTVALNAVSGDTDSLGFALYDYYLNQGAIVGTDVGTTGDAINGYVTDAYGKVLSTDALSTSLGNVDYTAYGYTPAVQFVTQSVAVTPAVPEPETYAMMLAGLAVVGLKLRRRQAAQA
ncbi:MAG: hypothetical protein RIQ53_3989 [Pseudomonadota bacterium]|jgi:hypothetical protein